MLSTIDTIPALLAGCAVIVKPSEITPRFVAPLMTTINTVPQLRDVLNFVEGAGQTGADLIEDVDLICFTGSVETGRIVAEAAAQKLYSCFFRIRWKRPSYCFRISRFRLSNFSNFVGFCCQYWTVMFIN